MIISLQVGICLPQSTALPLEQMSLISMRNTSHRLPGAGGKKKEHTFSQWYLKHVTFSLIVLLLNFTNSLNSIFTRGKYVHRF